METITQNEILKQHLLSGAKITSIEAIKRWSIFRLASRISDLRNDYGMPIHTELEHNANNRGHHGVYYIVSSDLEYARKKFNYKPTQPCKEAI